MGDSLDLRGKEREMSDADRWISVGTAKEPEEERKK